MENALRAKPQDVRQQYEKQISHTGRLWRSNVGVTCAKKAGGMAGAGRELIRRLQEQFQADGLKVSLSRLCTWFGVARRSVYYRSHKKAAVVKACYAEPIKQLIEAEPSFGYRTVAALLGMNKNTVQRVFQLKGWQVRKRSVGRRPRIQAVPSKAQEPNQRWSTDLCRVWGGQDGWLSLALVMDCHTRELLGWQLSKTGKASTAVSALEHALINRFRCLGKVPEQFLLRSDNGLVFTSRKYTALVKSYGLQQEFITPHCPQQNGMVERLIRTIKEQCVHRHRFESLQHANRVLSDWIQFYNEVRPHQALGMKTPAKAYALSL